MMNYINDFAALHVPGAPLILFNVWDAGSAKAVAAAGAKAIATGSWSVAAAHGLGDGENVPLDLVIVNAAEIARAVDLPVSIDFEQGYGEDAAQVAQSCARLAETGVIGINLEDNLRALGESAARVKAAADAGLFVNARTDMFIQSDPASHNAAMVDAALERARAYQDAGARSFFVPFLNDEALIADICARSPLPVNIMVMPDGPAVSRLAELGVARVSYGPGPYRAVMATLEANAKEAFAGA